MLLWYDDDYSDQSEIEQKNNFILTTNRKFATIEIEWNSSSEEFHIHEIIDRQGINVAKLTLCGGCIDSLVEFANLFNLTPNLNQMVIMSVAISHEISDVALNQVMPDLKKLKNLELRLTDWRIVKCFGKAKLTTIVIEENGFYDDYAPLVNFLLSQNMLKSLTVSCYQSLLSILDEIGKLSVSVPFQLKQLAIADLESPKSSNDHENVLRFIESQGQNLRQMEIGSGFPSTIYGSVFTMTELCILSVSINEIPRDKIFYEGLKDNNNVRTIVLHGYLNCDGGFLRNFFEKFPRARNIVLSSTNIGMMKNMLKPNIKVLRLCDVNKCSKDFQSMLPCTSYTKRPKW